ncbi:NlpC/P60 family protein [Corynebacterium fournieri]|uniref:C40 family peptidase n=1 Tax=Corynebacterium fournieri TaxID=1852390 RepID=UPI000A2EEB66|nr:C40 family peptidase [Corynebacterium fournieri]WJY97942.1 putative endopeptidase precursor [Corynebacterium fournieri]
MGKHSLHTNRSRSAAAVVAGSIVATSTLVAPPAQADDVDALIEELESVSQDATAKSEEIKELEDQIADSEVKLRSANSRAADAKAEMDTLRGVSDLQRKNVGDIAQSRYRMPQSDALLTTLDSGNPQEAIDRSAYLATLGRNSQRALTELEEVNRAAADRASAANIAVAEAQHARNELDSKRKKLEQERDELDLQVADIERRVDSLNEEDRQRWITKDNPVSAVDLPGVDSGIVAAAMAQLGKPYGWGATGPDAFDCSGLMVWAYAQNGIGIPRTSQAQLAGGTPVSLDALQPGDIIGYYPGVTHVGMYIGDGMVVHASDYGIPVQVVPVNSMPVQGAVRY